MESTIRAARIEDESAVIEFTADIWSDRGGDYIPRVFSEWVATDDESQHTLVAETAGEVVGLLQVVLVSEYEAWCQGMRVHPDYRGRGIGRAVTRRGFEWARDAGAVVARCMVFSWNQAGLGYTRSIGFSPVTEFRWSYPTPTPANDFDAVVSSNPSAAWRYWQRSDARGALNGLTLDLNESWALSDLTRARLERAANRDGLFVIQDDGTTAVSYRVREFPRETDSGVDEWAEYGVAAWEDTAAARALFAAIRQDAARIGCDRIQVLIPEAAESVSTMARLGFDLADEPTFVFEVDLTREWWSNQW